MPVLKSLSFTALPKSGNDPVQMRRAKFVAKLEEQKQLLKDPNHVRTVQRWTKVNGERQATIKQQAIRPWWKTDSSGQVVMSVKFGAKPIEFEKGKAGIVVGSKEKLLALIDTLIAAVAPGSWTITSARRRRPERSGSHGKLLDHRELDESASASSSGRLAYYRVACQFSQPHGISRTNPCGRAAIRTARVNIPSTPPPEAQRFAPPGSCWPR
jgi:hypothetical protein